MSALLKPYEFTPYELEKLHLMSAKLGGASKYGAPKIVKSEVTLEEQEEQIEGDHAVAYAEMLNETPYGLELFSCPEKRDAHIVSFRRWVVGRLFLQLRLPVGEIAALTGYANQNVNSLLDKLMPGNPKPV